MPIFTSALDGNWAWENPGKKEREGGKSQCYCAATGAKVKFKTQRGKKGGKKKDLGEEVRIAPKSIVFSRLSAHAPSNAVSIVAASSMSPSSPRGERKKKGGGGRRALIDA